MKPFSTNRRSRGPGRALTWLLLLILLVVIGGLIALAVVDVPAPVHHIEQLVPNDRSPGA